MYRLDYNAIFWNSWRSSLAKHCVILSCFVAISYVCSPTSLAQFTHPFANASFDGNYKKLQKNFQQLLSGVTLRSAIEQICKAHDILIWLDRRVDGEQIVNLQLDEATLQQAIDALVAQTKLHQTWVGAVPYICRPEDATAVELAYWSIATANNGHLLGTSAEAWSWQKPEHPKDLFDQFVTKSKLQVSNSDLISHDYWAAREVPALDVATILTLLLAGFDLTLRHSNNHWELIPVNVSEPDVTFAYDEKLMQGIPRKGSTAWQELWKGKTQWRTQRDKRWLKAPVLAHRDLYISTLKLPDPVPATPKTSSDDAALIKKIEQSRFETHLRGRLIDILPPLFKQLKLNWTPSELSTELGERTIDVQARNFTIDELLKAIGKSSDCAITRDKLTVTIKAK